MSLIWIVLAVLFLLALLAGTDARPADPEPTEAEPGGDGPAELDVLAGGPIAPSLDGGWILDPDALFPITVRGIPERSAQELRDALDDGTRGDVDSYRQRIFDVVSGRAFSWDELETFVTEHAPVFEAEVARRLQATPGIAGAPPGARAAQEARVRREVASELVVQPACQLDVLLSCASATRTYVPALVTRYGYRILDLYLAKADSSYRACLAAPGSSEHEELSALVRARLAVTGIDVPLRAVLETFDDEVLVDLATKLEVDQPGRRKQLVFALSEADGIATEMNGLLSGRDVFQLLALPAEICDPTRVDVLEIVSSWRFAQEVVTLLCRTHRASRRAVDSVARVRSRGLLIRGWEIVPGPDHGCPLARCQRDLPHSGDDPPMVPLHVGCTCQLRPVVSDQPTSTDLHT